MSRRHAEPLAALLIVGAVALFAGQAPAAVILSDTFSTDTVEGGGSVTFDNLPVEVPQTPGDTWGRSNSGSRTYVDNGTLFLAASNLSSDFGKAIAPFDDTGITQTIRLTWEWGIDMGSSADTSMTFYGGLGNSASDGSAFVDNQLAVGFRFAGQNFTGTSVTIIAGRTANPTSGNQAGSTTVTRADTSAVWHATLALTFDPTTDIAEFFVNGSSIGTIDYTGDIGGVWLKGDYVDSINTSGMMVDNLVLETVPEPATLSCLALGAVALLKRRRH